MAEKIKIDQLTQEDREFIQNSLEIETTEIFDISKGILFLPLAFARNNFELNQQSVVGSPIKFTASLRDGQCRIKSKAMENLSSRGFSIISSAPGFGKTITALSIACDLGLTTAIIVNKLILIDQWKTAIEKFTEGSVQIVSPKMTSLDPACNFFIVNAINVSKKSSKFWKRVNFLIVDELHQIVTRVYSIGLLKFCPRFLLGLSATPFRFDEYDKAIEWFFGSNKIGESLNVKHRVRIIDTGFKPVVKFSRQGLDWNSVLKDQSENEERNKLIVDSVTSFKNKTWLILVKRVAHAQLLSNLFLSNHQIKCATLTGTTTSFDKTSQILIGTTSKIGVGFDHAAIDALCVAADVKNYFVQFLGRCMRRPDCEPLVLDFRDSFGPLIKHLNERISEYEKYGGLIEKPKLSRK